MANSHDAVSAQLSQLVWHHVALVLWLVLGQWWGRVGFGLVGFGSVVECRQYVSVRPNIFIAFWLYESLVYFWWIIIGLPVVFVKADSMDLVRSRCVWFCRVWQSYNTSDTVPQYLYRILDVISILDIIIRSEQFWCILVRSYRVAFVKVEKIFGLDKIWSGRSG